LAIPAAAAEGIANGLVRYFADRALAVRLDALIPGGEAGSVASPVGDGGPPFWAPSTALPELAHGIPVRLTNTGTDVWPAGLRVLTGWQPSDEPYLRQPPETVAELGVEVPQLAPGESVVLLVQEEAPAGEAGLLWITLAHGDETFSDLGSAPLQLRTGGT